MKKYLLIIAFFATVYSFGQNQQPVAVNDTVLTPAKMGDYVTVNVLQNDYDPDGDSLFIYTSNGSYSTTDSTITYFLGPNVYIGQDKKVVFQYKNYDKIVASQNGRVIIPIENDYFAYLDVNNIKARFNCFGNHFWDMEAINEYYYPKDSSTNTIFNFAFWLGGIDEAGDLRLAAERYRQVGNDYWNGPLTTDGSASIDTATSMQWYNTWKLNIEEIEYHLLHWNDPGYEPIEDIATWPAHGDVSLMQDYNIAPYIDVNTNDLYEPLLGDYPLIRGDQTIFFVLNDQITHSETGGLSIGIEIHGFAYAFNSPENPALNNTTFLSYKIFNRSEHTLTDTYAGTFTDIDLGDFSDDFIGCDVGRGAYFGYNGDDYDGEDSLPTPFSYGYNPPAQGIVILGGPYLPADGLDNPAGECDESINGVGFGDGIADNERFGMNNFIYFNNGGLAATSDPSIDYEYYNFMKLIWKDSTAMEYGGNGHVSSGAYGPAAKFMFPGMSDPCFWGTDGEEPYGPIDWTEETSENEPGDRRGICSMGPFTLEAGGFHKVDIAFVTAPGDENTNSVDRLMTYIDTVKTLYFEDSDHFGYAWLGNEEHKIEPLIFKLFPNPASSVLYVQFEDIQKTTLCEISDLYGSMVKQINISNTRSSGINISGLKPGIYIVRIKTSTELVSKKFVIQ